MQRLEPEFAQAEVFQRPWPLRPSEQPLHLPDRAIVDAGVALGPVAVRVEQPDFIALWRGAKSNRLW